MTVFVLWVVIGGLIAAAYGGLLLLLKTLIRTWAFLVGPTGFLAFFAALIYYDLTVQRDHIPTTALMILFIICLLWAAVPAFTLYRITRRPEQTPALVQVGYAVGAFYMVTLAALALAWVIGLVFHVPLMSR